MTTADWAFVISLLSLVLSLCSFIWSVWSKFLHPKPGINVRFAMSIVFDSYAKNHVITLDATNVGPGHTTLRSVVCRIRKPRWQGLRSRWQYGLLNPLDEPTQTELEQARGPFAGGLPAKIDVGERHTAYLLARHSVFRYEKVVDVCFDDVFGRHLWARRSQVRDVRRRVKELFDQDEASAGR